jgi:hypothetical protein
MEAKNVLVPGFVTGGEALATELVRPSCRLRKLDLSWNSIR